MADVKWTSDAWSGSVAWPGHSRETGKVPSTGRRRLPFTVRRSGGTYFTGFALHLRLGFVGLRFRKHRGIMAINVVSTVLAHPLLMCEAGLILVWNGARGTRATPAILVEAICLDLLRRWRAVCVLAILAKFVVVEQIKEFAGDSFGCIFVLGSGTTRRFV